MNEEDEIKIKTDRCVNPYNIEGHKGKGLRKIPQSLVTKFPSIPNGSVICYKCRRMSDSDYQSEHDTSMTNESNSFETFCSSNSVGENEISHQSVPENSTITSAVDDLSAILKGLKEKFFSLPPNDPDRITILTILPLNWTIDRICSEFKTSSKSVRKAKELKKLHGSLSRPTPKLGKAITITEISKVSEFYEDDDNSRVLPGVKNKKSITVDGVKVLKQKRLLLFNLKELHTKFKLENPDTKIGISKFCELRPQNCVSAGAAGTHVVCVCLLHQNFKLMLDAINLLTLTKDAEFPLQNYHDCLDFVLCRQPRDECHFNTCKICSGSNKLTEYLQELLQICGKTEIKYSIWCATDRATMETKTSSRNNFLAELSNIIEKLKIHDFIHQKQTSYFQELKQNLNDNEILVLCDFSENFAFVVQDAVQAFHYNNNQASIYTVVYYYSKDGELCHENVVIISDCLSHDSVAVYICNSILTEHIKKHHDVEKIIYISDGAKQQFKNRFNIKNLMKHNSDFGLKAEWHFHVTAHGKGPHDGLGAAVKIKARRASLQASPVNSILTAEQLFNWSKQNIKNIEFFYFSSKLHETVKRRLKSRFDNAQAVPKIQSKHTFIPVSDTELKIKTYSSAKESVSVKY